VGHELLAVVVYGALAAEQRQFAQWRVCQRWPEAVVYQLDEVRPCRKTAVELEPMEPQLRIIEEMERSIRYLLMFWRATYLEVAIASIEPR
jgi:hypothetical protein